MSAKCTLDLTSFRAGLAHKRSQCKKALAEIENQAGKNICLRAVQFTEGANKAEIRAALASNGLVFKLLQSRKFQDRLPRRFAGKAFAKRSAAELRADATAFIAMRARTVKNVAAGWIKAARAFGGALNRRVSDKGNTGKGYGGKATPSRLVAFGVNTANGASKVGLAGLQKAVDFVGRDMLSYGPKRLKEATK